MRSPAQAWREHPQRYRLEAVKCASCGHIEYPPRLVCSKCRSREFEPTVLPRDGKVETFTVIHVAPPGFHGQTPLVLSLVELENGTRLMVQLTDVEDPATVEIGMPVRLEFRRITEDGEAGVLFYGHKAVPA